VPLAAATSLKERRTESPMTAGKRETQPLLSKRRITERIIRGVWKPKWRSETPNP